MDRNAAMERTDLLQSREQMEPAGKPKFEMINVEQPFESPQEIHSKQIAKTLDVTEQDSSFEQRTNPQEKIGKPEKLELKQEEQLSDTVAMKMGRNAESEMGKIGGEMDKTTTAPKIDDKPAQLKLKATKPKEKIETPMERLKR